MSFKGKHKIRSKSECVSTFLEKVLLVMYRQIRHPAGRYAEELGALANKGHS